MKGGLLLSLTDVMVPFKGLKDTQNGVVLLQNLYRASGMSASLRRTA